MLKRALLQIYSWDSHADEGLVRQAKPEDWISDLVSSGFDPEVALVAVMIHDEIHGTTGGIDNLERFENFIHIAF